MREHLFCLGYGYVARRLGWQACFEHWKVSGTSRSAENAVRLGAACSGIEVHVWPGGDADLEDLLTTATGILISAPPGPSGDPVLPFMPRLSRRSPLRWVGYLSTVGVYGDTDGNWVDETAAPAPVQPRSVLRLAAERAWQAWGAKNGVTVQIFRLPGIYGPGRSAFDRVRDGTARRIVREGHVFSRIHVDDIVGAVFHVLDRPELQAIPVLNLVDDEPATPADVLVHACALLDIPPPPEERFEDVAADLSPMASGFWSERRRVSNRRLKTVCGYSLKYPTFRQGLAAILAEEMGKKLPKRRQSMLQRCADALTACRSA